MSYLQKITDNSRAFIKRHMKGLFVIFGATAIFFAPLIPQIGTYSDGGDAMFNAWTLARNHHCILLQDCPKYSNGNIYFPNKDSMLYSETQLSAGLLTLPLHFIDKNPIFAYNVWTIFSMFFSGFFMYLLAKRLSNNSEAVSIIAGLIFEFAPIKMTALGHLQNLSIFYLPLIILIILKVIERKNIKKTHILSLLIVLILFFYASWYQMVFGLMAIGTFLLGAILLKYIDLKKFLLISGVVALATLSTLPLAVEYVRFSKEKGASFTIAEQIFFSSSVKDYFIPYSGTYGGDLYYSIRPSAKVNSYNPDSSSFHGYTLYVITLIILVLGISKYRKKFFYTKDRKLLYIFFCIGVVGLIVSFGPALKIGSDYAYPVPGIAEKYVIPMPYAAVDKFLPQLSFIRAIGRASILFLFALCCIVAVGAKLLENIPKKKRLSIIMIAGLLLAFELAPKNAYAISQNNYSHTFTIPKIYQYIKDRPEINNLIILRSDSDYPGAPIPVVRAEDTLWAGYHNRNIYNGYSGYEPKPYQTTYIDFVDFQNDDVKEMKKLGLRYIVLDKRLSSNGDLTERVSSASLTEIYEDNRYKLLKL